MNLRQIEAFRAVMMTGTVTGAAELLHVSQPAISRLIADIERSTGLRLFIREKRRLQPTQEAMTFYSEVQHSFSGLEALKKKARDIRNFNTGQLRVVANSALAAGFLPRVLHEFLDEHPNVTVSFQSQQSTIVKEWVAAQQFDIGLSFGAVENATGVEAELFADVRGVCILPPGHRLTRKRVIKPCDLENEKFVSLGASDLTRHGVQQVLDTAGVNLIVNIETPLATVACSIVLDGGGVSIVNPFTAEDFRDRGLIIKPFEPAIPIQFWSLLPTFRPRSALADSFIAILNKHRDRALGRFRKTGLLSRR